MSKYCDNCGLEGYLREVILKDASGTAIYCANCIYNNPHVTITKNENVASKPNALKKLYDSLPERDKLRL